MIHHACAAAGSRLRLPGRLHPLLACCVFVEVDGLGSSGVEAARVVLAVGAIGGGVVSVAGVVDQPVVVATQGYREVKVGEPAFRPRLLVVQL